MNKSELKSLAEKVHSLNDYGLDQLAQGLLYLLEENQKLKRDHTMMRDGLKDLSNTIGLSEIMRLHAAGILSQLEIKD